MTPIYRFTVTGLNKMKKIKVSEVFTENRSLNICRQLKLETLRDVVEGWYDINEDVLYKLGSKSISKFKAEAHAYLLERGFIKDRMIV